MFAQAMSSTMPVTPKSRVSGARASRDTPLWPRDPSAMVIWRARKRASVCSLIFCSGASTSVVMAWYGTLMAVLACSREMPGFKRANRYAQ